MLREVFQNLDQWLQDENLAALKEGLPSTPKVEIRVVGQTALLEADLDIYLAATMDVDTKNQLYPPVKTKFEELLKERGKVLDPVGHEAWMPEETTYQKIFEGLYVIGSIAEPVFVILSKAKTAPEKNRQLITEYLTSKKVDKRINKLAKKYKVNLSLFI